MCSSSGAACQAGRSIYSASLDDVVRKRKIAEATGRFNKHLNALLRPSVLVVDEVDYLRLEREEANMFFQLISRRYERGSTIITSNKSFHEWGPSSATITRHRDPRQAPAPLRSPAHQRTQLPAAQPDEPHPRLRHGIMNPPDTDTSGRTKTDTSGRTRTPPELMSA